MIKLIKKVSIFLRNGKRKVSVGKKKFKIKTKTGCYELNTIYGHPLKNYLKKMKFYDRFLPYLVKNTSSGLIDIGSNIGDTLTLSKIKIKLQSHMC